MAPVGLIFVADYSKMNMDENLNFFYSAVDTGYISQNVYLFCAAEGLSTVVLGWVDKENLSKTLGLTAAQHIILSQPVGYSKEYNTY
ncbi:MAG: nitroreductase family protein [Candidatus Omnitrophica bacterium]|nr:nitroreductase family protein [Candidatus Omnitrophota bacterium]